MANSIFGDTPLIVSSKGGKKETAPASSVLGGKTTVLLYFSAHWCPPCRNFTPKLSKFYETLKKKRDDFEVVFVSADQDESDFAEYHAEMPFPALDPFEHQELTESIQKRFGIEGFPTLVVANADGTVITDDGREGVESDANGDKFPWTPKTAAEILGDSVPLIGNGASHAKSLGDLRRNGVTKVAFYVSASWCGPCVGFTPVLAETYKAMVGRGQKAEIIFVTCDRDEASFKAYFGKMPWMALPWKDEHAEPLKKWLKTSGIPHLVTVDLETNEIINLKGRGAASNDPEGEKFPWVPEAPVPVASLHSEQGIETLQSGGPVAILDLYCSGAPNPPLDDEAAVALKAFEDRVKSLPKDSSKLRFLAVHGSHKKREKDQCPAGHDLKANDARADFGCDACGGNNTVRECRQCNFDICEKCYESAASALPVGPQLLNRVLEGTGTVSDRAEATAMASGPALYVYGAVRPGGLIARLPISTAGSFAGNAALAVDEAVRTLSA